MPAGLDVTVPTPVPVLVTASETVCTLKLAVTFRAAVIVTVHVAPETESQPLHALNSDPLFGAAESVTVVPPAYGSEQSAPQLIPAGFEVTTPAPAPVLLTPSVKLATLKLAVTVRALLIATLHVVPDTESQPVHPAKTEPAFAAAVIVTVVPMS